MSQQNEKSSFAERVADLLERVQYRRADTLEEKETIFRLRYEAYRREGNIEPNPRNMLTDPDDERPNVWLIAIFIDNSLAASIRLHIASRPEHWLPVTGVFPDILLPRLQAGACIVDGSRMSSRLEYARAYPFLPYVAIRAAFMAAEHFQADFISAACRPEYIGAYRRMGGAVVWAPPRRFPQMTRQAALMAYECERRREAVHARFPFAHSTPESREALFSRSSNAWGEAYAEFTRGCEARRGERQQSTICAA